MGVPSEPGIARIAGIQHVGDFLTTAPVLGWAFEQMQSAQKRMISSNSVSRNGDWKLRWRAFAQ